MANSPHPCNPDCRLRLSGLEIEVHALKAQLTELHNENRKLLRSLCAVHLPTAKSTPPPNTDKILRIPAWRFPRLKSALDFVCRLSQWHAVAAVILSLAGTFAWLWSNQCQATTANGHRCEHRANLGESLCPLHGGLSQAAIANQTPTHRCGAPTIGKQTPCMRIVANAGNKCFQHRAKANPTP